MKVKFWGTRGSTPVPGKETIIYGGNTTSLEITLNSGTKIIVDAGTGIRSLGNELESSADKIDIHLLISHIHWDHILGFPFFPPIYRSSTRILVDGYTLCMKGLRYSFDNRMGDGFFPIRFEELKSDIQFINKLSIGPREIDGVRIDSIPLRHPQGGLGFRFKEEGKTLVFLTDNELDVADRSFTDYVKFCEGADILIHDSQYTPDEIFKHRGWGHSDCQSVMDLAMKAQVKRLVFFHHAPERSDSEIIKTTIHCQDQIEEKNADMVIESAKEKSVLFL